MKHEGCQRVNPREFRSLLSVSINLRRGPEARLRIEGSNPMHFGTVYSSPLDRKHGDARAKGSISRQYT